MSFATVAELRTYVDNNTLDQTRAQQALDFATGKIQLHTGQTFTETEDATITLRGTWGDTLYLPQRPVTAIDSITVDGVLAAANTYVWTSDGKVTLTSDPSYVINLAERDGGHWGGGDVRIVVVYSFGLDPIPDVVKAVCLALAARQLSGAADGGAVASESLGAYSVTYSRSSGLELTSDEKETLRPYRRGAGTIPVRP